MAHGGYRPYTERYNASTAGENRLTELYVYMKEGETVSFGTSIKDAVARFTNEKMGTNLSDAELAALNQCDIVVCGPNWVQEQQDSPGTGNTRAYPYFQGVRDTRVTTYDVNGAATADSGTAGYIGSVAREAGGPTGPDGNGYTPLTFTAQKSGVYLFKFYSQSLSSRNPQPYLTTDDRAFTSAAQAGGSIAAWDITVSNGDDVQNGRVFTKKLFLNMGNNFDKAGILKSHMFAVTDDNYHYEIDFNGMDPFGFVFFANNRGLLDGSLDDRAGTRSLYHSVRSQNNALSDLAEHGVILNNAPTNELDHTYKLFFNNPTDPEVLAALGIATPSGENAISNFTFTGNPSPNPAAPELKANEGFVGAGGTFSFDVGDVAATSYEITLDFGDNNTVTLSNTLVKNGTNTIAWDGLDANGVKVPAGTYDLNNVAIKLKGGEVHFPLLDVENNYDGVKIHRLGADGSPVDSTVYYNNSSSNAGDVTPPWSMSNWAVADTQDHSVTGVDTSSQGAMAYQNRAGDQTALDIWAYHDTPIVLQNFQFKLMDVPTKLSVRKTWDHGANHADPLPSSIDVELLADGTVIDTQTLTAPTVGGEDGGSYTWTGLDPNKNYTVREANVPEGYQPSEAITGNNDEGWSIDLVNTYTGNVTTVEVEKQWSGTQPPAELPISVVGRDAADNVQFRQDFVLNAGNNWKATIDNLTSDQQALWFFIEETLPDGYRQIGDANKLTPNGDGTSTLSFTITNQKVIDLTVTKAWDDDDNSQGIRPTTVEMQLLKDGQPFGDPVILSEENNWSYTWKDLVDDGSYSAFKVYESSDLGEYTSSADPPRQRGRLRRRRGHRHEHAAAYHVVHRDETVGCHTVREHAPHRRSSAVPERRTLRRPRPPRRYGQLAAHLVRPAPDYCRGERGVVLRVGDQRAARLRGKRREYRQPGGHHEHLHGRRGLHRRAEGVDGHADAGQHRRARDRHEHGRPAAVRLGRGDPHRRGRLARRAAHRRRHAHPDLRRDRDGARGVPPDRLDKQPIRGRQDPHAHPREREARGPQGNEGLGRRREREGPAPGERADAAAERQRALRRSG